MTTPSGAPNPDEHSIDPRSSDGAIDIFSEVDGIELLQKTPLFARLGFDETQRLAELVRIERWKRGQLVVEQDSLGQALYIVRRGEVAVYDRDASGARHEVSRLGEGELFGEMSLVDDLLASADVEVESDEAELLVIPRDGFEKLVESDDRLAVKVYRSFCRTLSERLRRQNQRLIGKTPRI